MTEKNQVEQNEFDMDVAGLKVAIRRHPRFLTLNGYVGVPKGHVLYGVTAENLIVTQGFTPPHRGFSYAGTGEDSQFSLPRNYWFFGFDTAHKGDKIPGKQSLLHRIFHGSDESGEYRSMKYVKHECSKLIVQFKRLTPTVVTEATDTVQATVEDDTDDALLMLAITALLTSDDNMPLPDGVSSDQIFDPFVGGGGQSGGAGASGSWEDAPTGTPQPNAPETPDTSYAASMADLKESLNQHTFTTPDGPVDAPTPASQDDDDSGYSNSSSSDDSSSSSSSSDDSSSSSSSDYSDSSSSSDYSSSDSSSSCDSSSSDF